jgi:hypothetical protein
VGIGSCSPRQPVAFQPLSIRRHSTCSAVSREQTVPCVSPPSPDLASSSAVSAGGHATTPEQVIHGCDTLRRPTLGIPSRPPLQFATCFVHSGRQPCGGTAWRSRRPQGVSARWPGSASLRVHRQRENDAVKPIAWTLLHSTSHGRGPLVVRAERYRSASSRYCWPRATMISASHAMTA